MKQQENIILTQETENTSATARAEEEVTLHIIPNMVQPVTEPTEEETVSPEHPAPALSEEYTEEEPEKESMARKVVIGVLSILAIVLLFPIALAFAAFGIPVLNGSLMNT